MKFIIAALIFGLITLIGMQTQKALNDFPKEDKKAIYMGLIGIVVAICLMGIQIYIMGLGVGTLIVK